MADGRIRRHTVALFDAALHTATAQGWHRAAEAISRGLREARGLHSTERRVVADALHQLVRELRRLRALTGVPQPTALQLYLTWLLDEERAGGRSPAPPAVLYRELGAAGLSAEAIAERARGLSPPLPPALLGEALSYPDWLVTALIEDFGAPAAQDILIAQNQRAPLVVRANLLKGTRAELRERLQAEGIASSETPLSPWGLELHTRVNVYGLAAFREGWLEIQDEGSQLIAELVAPPPGGVVADACAGAGGKTLALGGMMGNRGRILALDIDGRKLIELRARARRAGLTNVQALAITGEQPLRPLLPHGAARVLVDAPCSGLGVLRRNPEARWRLVKGDVEELRAKGRAILESAATLVQEHGRLIYATCTLLRRENDEVVDGFLADHPEFSPVPVKEIVGGQRAALMGDGMRLRLVPAPGGGPDGFFAAVLRRGRGEAV